MKDKTVLQLHSLLKQYGIRYIVTSPGCRQFSLITALEQDDFFTLYSVVDERSAAFFALGLIQEKKEPVAIMCTSGTACANYSSAAVEAFYQRLPLLIISGDRMREFINQQEDQLYDQIETFKGFTKVQVQLPKIESEVDEWYTNRLINEALIELTHHGRGPVHIDYPTVDIFAYRATPEDFITARKIDLVTPVSKDSQFKELAEKMKNKKVAIFWGQTVWQNEELKKAVNDFVKKFDAVILTDYMSNCRFDNTIIHTYRIITAKKSGELNEQLRPDILISVGANTIFNAEMKGFMREANAMFWQVGNEDKIIDGHRRLNCIFEMPEEFFFRKMVESAHFSNKNHYFETWKEVDDKVKSPDPQDFNELYALKHFVEKLPAKCSLQLANSWSTRMTQLLDIRPDIEVNCNRGANGIDGSMSTAVGYSVSNKNLTFLCIGDLSFFYDMNSLSIKHLPNRLRVFMINNQGGSMLYRGFMKEMLERQTVNHLGIGKLLNAEGWSKTCGFEYLSAHNLEEYNSAIEKFTDKEIDKPMLLEVFTDFFEDADSVIGQCFNDLRTSEEKLKNKLGNVARKFGLRK